MDDPAVFSDIPPKTCFQSLHIFNKGKLPAKNIRVCLDEEAIKSCHVEYKLLTEDDFSVETKKSVRILKFERLLPGDRMQISFKSSEPPPRNFIAWVKSDEMVSEVSRGEAGISSSLLNYAGPVFALAAVLLSLYFAFNQITRLVPGPPTEAKSSEKAKAPFVEIILSTDKRVYSKSEQMQVTYSIQNITRQPLSDFLVLLEMPGFNLDYNSQYRKKPFLAGEEEFLQKIPVQIPKDIPPGKYKITAIARGDSLDKRLTDEAQTFFEVR